MCGSRATGAAALDVAARDRGLLDDVRSDFVPGRPEAGLRESGRSERVLSPGGLRERGLSVPGLSVPGLSVPGLSVPGLSDRGLSAPGLLDRGLPPAELAGFLVAGLPEVLPPDAPLVRVGRSEVTLDPLRPVDRNDKGHPKVTFVEECPAASYSPTQSPEQYHRR
jgi:hypothetical protein